MSGVASFSKISVKKTALRFAVWFILLCSGTSCQPRSSFQVPSFLAERAGRPQPPGPRPPPTSRAWLGSGLRCRAGWCQVQWWVAPGTPRDPPSPSGQLPHRRLHWESELASRAHRERVTNGVSLSPQQGHCSARALGENPVSAGKEQQLGTC